MRVRREFKAQSRDKNAELVDDRHAGGNVQPEIPRHHYV
jgi:hypothetical protein